MTAIRVIQKPENGKLIITVPDEMQDELMIVDFRPAQEEVIRQPNAGLAEASKAFFNRLKRVKTDFNNEEYDVYEQ